MGNALKITFAILMLASSVSADAYCFKEAAAKYKTDPLLLYAMAEQESTFNQYAYNRSNKNKTYDIGLMQINSDHLTELMKMGITEADLVNNACLNVMVGAWYLARNFVQYGISSTGYWEAVGAYNAGTAKTNLAHNARMEYSWKIYKRMVKHSSK